MLDFLGLCRELRSTYPIPASPELIKASILNRVGHVPTRSLGFDMAKALAAKWKREGWVWDSIGAVKVLLDENIIFDDYGVTILNPHEGDVFIPVGTFHPRVVWFR